VAPRAGRRRGYAGMSDTATVVDLGFPACIAREFPREFPIAWHVASEMLTTIAASDLAPLARRSPGLRGYDWTEYLRCSVVRMVRVLSALNRHVPAGGRVLDVGAYFGNFANACARAGYQVDAIDAYREYAPAFDACIARMTAERISVLDFADAGDGLGRLPEQSYDAILCLGVVEHVPHTPRVLLDALRRLLAPGGLLVIDTPNTAYLYNRQKLARGQTVMVPLEVLYDTELPFEGHHREYTVDEVRWLIDRLQLEPVTIETFNYSIYSMRTLAGEHLDNYRRMQRDPSMREVIFAAARRSSAAG